MSDIRWEDPPPRRKSPRTNWGWVLRPLTEQPKRWAIVHVTKTRDAARQLARNLNDGHTKIPPGQWEFTWETVDDEHRIYARYLGPDEPGGES